MACVHSYKNYDHFIDGSIPICCTLGQMLRDVLEFFKGLYVLTVARTESELEIKCTECVVTELDYMC